MLVLQVLTGELPGKLVATVATLDGDTILVLDYRRIHGLTSAERIATLNGLLAKIDAPFGGWALPSTVLRLVG